jgi:hypothetical protein
VDALESRLYLAFLGLGGGALWPRYFLPLVPSLFVLSVPGLVRWDDRYPRHMVLFLALVIVGNLAYVANRPGLACAGARLTQALDA